MQARRIGPFLGLDLSLHGARSLKQTVSLDADRHVLSFDQKLIGLFDYDLPPCHGRPLSARGVTAMKSADEGGAVRHLRRLKTGPSRAGCSENRHLKSSGTFEDRSERAHDSAASCSKIGGERETTQQCRQEV